MRMCTLMLSLMMSFAKSRTDCRLERSSFLTSTFVLSLRSSSRTVSAFPRSRQARITRAPARNNFRNEIFWPRISYDVWQSIIYHPSSRSLVNTQSPFPPLLSRSRAVSLPMPMLAPVMMTVCPTSLLVEVHRPPAMYLLKAITNATWVRTYANEDTK